MNDLFDYLAAAVILALQTNKNRPSPDTFHALKMLLKDEFEVELSQDDLVAAVARLEQWSLATVMEDPYAGDMIGLSRAVALRYENAPTVIVQKALSGGLPWIARVLGNRDFWHDLARLRISSELAPADVMGSAPASDRIVTFSDSQIGDLDAQTTEIIAAVSGQNQIADSPGLRELILGQLRAGRELIRAGSFRLHFLELTLIETLRFLAQRYEREAIGGLASALIVALLKQIGIDS